MWTRSTQRDRKLPRIAFSKSVELQRWEPELLANNVALNFTETNQTMKILIAEDEPMVLRTIQLYLNRAGFEVVTATNGRDAMTVFDFERPAMVVTDMLMPFATGNELISHIRNTRESQVPILVVSTIGLENSVISALNLGADDYIVKPLRLNEVVARVNRFLRA